MDFPVTELFYASPSPFVRKVRIVAHETDQALSLIPTFTTPVAQPDDLVGANPLGKVPALRMPSGELLYDSTVICRWLGEGSALYPTGASLWRALRREALADGLLEAGLLVRYEATLRPENLRWQEWTQAQMDKIDRALAVMAADAPNAERPDIGDIATGCALAYLDFRFPQLNWRGDYPILAGFLDQIQTRPSFQNTRPE